MVIDKPNRRYVRVGTLAWFERLACGKHLRNSINRVGSHTRERRWYIFAILCNVAELVHAEKAFLIRTSRQTERLAQVNATGKYAEINLGSLGLKDRWIVR